MMQCRRPTTTEQEIWTVRNFSHTQQVSVPRINILGTFTSAGNFSWEQISPGVSIHYIYGGSGIFESDGSSYEVSSGQVFLFWPGQHIRYWDHPETPWRYIWMFLESPEHASIFAEAGLHRGISHIQIHNIARFTRELDVIVSTFQRGTYGPVYPHLAAITMLHTLQECSIHTKDELLPLAEHIRRIIDGDRSHTITISSLAQTLGVDRSTLYRSFKQQYGLSIKEYCQEIRMDKAQQMLRYSPTSIKEIAWTLGFSDWRQFSKTFKYRFGLSPLSWRLTQHAQQESLII